MNTAKIAKQLNSSNMMVWYLLNNKRKTLNIQLAVELAKLTKRAPIEFLSDKIKDLALQINPKLNKKIK
jgi:hypothetical protein